MFRNYRLKNLNIRLIIACVALTIIGVLVVGSARGGSNGSYQNKQIMGMILGVIVMTIVAMIDYSFLLQFAWVYYVLADILLILVIFRGSSSLGAQRWLRIGGFRFQPSEFAKVLLILFFAYFLMRIEDRINKPRTLLMTLLISAFPLFLIVREPDLSTTIVTFMIIAIMVFSAGLSYKIVGTVLGITVPAITIFLVLESRGKSLLRGYQDERILAWLNPEKYPEKAYQQQNSIMAIGSGQLFGKGLFNTSAYSVKNGNYIPEPHTDFIFAVVGEEMGFIGSCVIIILLLIIAIECLRVSKKAKDTAGRLICIGIASWISIQSFVNISVVTGLLPNPGLTLPFVSYGLTSLVTLYIGIGLVLNVGLQAKKNYIDEKKPLTW